MTARKVCRKSVPNCLLPWQCPREAMALTEHKLKAGDISLIDNIMELSLYYSLADEVLATSCDYALALADSMRGIYRK